MLRLIYFYQRWVSPLLPPRCRFVPTCSSFAAEAIETHGTIRGGVMALRRICRCHPFHPGGFDPVPTGKAHEADRFSKTIADHDQPTSNRQNTLDQ